MSLFLFFFGLSGSGKSYLAKMLRDIEVENGGSAPRIHSMDDYFMIEVEKVPFICFFCLILIISTWSFAEFYSFLQLLVLFKFHFFKLFEHLKYLNHFSLQSDRLRKVIIQSLRVQSEAKNQL